MKFKIINSLSSRDYSYSNHLIFHCGIYSANYLYSPDKWKIEKKEDIHEEVDNMNEMREKKMNRWSKLPIFWDF